MALADLESKGHVHQLLTQNVDGLHQQAGSRRVIDLHGRLDTVECLACSAPVARDDFQNELETRNPDWTELIAETAPDGDVKLDGVDFDTFDVPKCNKCAGNLKPSVVFFGETIPRERLGTALKRLDEADALLVAGSSLMVFSGYRFAREAHRRGIPVGVVNIGHTRADNEITFKVEGRCGDVLPKLTDRL